MSPTTARAPLAESARRSARWAPLALVAAVLATSVVGAATAETTDPVYTACLTTKGALVKVAVGTAPSQTCGRGEQQISWNSKGQAGAAGAVGATGPAGVDGADGRDGADGVTGSCPPGSFVTGVSEGTVQCGSLGATYVFLDADRDGYGDPQRPLPLLGTFAQPSSYVTNDDDCDDTRSFVNPGERDDAGDGFDTNCDGEDGTVGPTYWYLDTDGDGWGTGSPVEVQPFGTPPEGYGLGNYDCDENDPTIFPNAPDPVDGIDQSCNGFDGRPVWPDLDADGFGVSADNGVDFIAIDDVPGPLPDGFAETYGDCNDDDGDINPAAGDVANDGIDNNCDGLFSVWIDGDGDGWTNFGLDNAAADPATALAGFDYDCNDGDAAINPGVPDAPGNVVDENCDGNIPVYEDVDRDGYGAALLFFVPTFSVPAEGRWAPYPNTWVSVYDGDCNDFELAVFPGQVDPSADGTDNDCDGLDGEDAG